MSPLKSTFLLITFLVAIPLSNLFAQKPTLTQLTKTKVDSLRKTGADAIMWYKSYCGECEVISHETHPASIPANHYCTVDAQGYTLTDNVILYKQNDSYYKLIFDCTYPLKKEKLDSCRSIAYFISIVPVLNHRDRAIKALYKSGRFLGPSQSDGGFEDVTLYLKKASQRVSMADGEKGDMYAVYKKYFWINKEIKLLDLIEKDIAIKNK